MVGTTSEQIAKEASGAVLKAVPNAQDNDGVGVQAVAHADVGIAGCLTFATWKLWRMTRDASVSLHRARLRFRGAVSSRW